MLQQRDQRRRRHAGDPCGGAQGGRPRRGELAADFARQAADRGVVEVGGKQQRLVAPERGDVPCLPFEIAGIAGVDFELLGDLGRRAAPSSARSRRDAPDRRRDRPAAPRLSAATPSSLTVDPVTPQRRRASCRSSASRRRAVFERRHFRGKAPLALAADARRDAMPIGVSRWSALSARRVSRYSAREVNIR